MCTLRSRLLASLPRTPEPSPHTVSSTALPELSGSWYRAFNWQLYDYFASNADYAWGALSVESGWTTTWIASAFAFRALNMSEWDVLVSDANGVDAALFKRICPEFFAPAVCAK